ncbi:sterol carrier family protein [Nocardioides sp. YIM 152315]|uniref:sterol carrier family protein n=1 Tax=Nocardioides sp. YIM 152315 TaxID=3031760 RepID=UPI0023DC9E5F|nr:sterol carrier family protein [Nocardioides sp. YIM 152315]MDF1605066.1 sterol carrier family protein [Nocardioides sp. YIM 152315]
MPGRLRRLTSAELAVATEAGDLRALTKHFLAVLEERAPGHSVEVRVPPYAAVQVVPGVRHTRGTPPAVVEMDARTWIDLATGELAWHDAEEAARVRASGERADLSPYLPLR